MRRFSKTSQRTKWLDLWPEWDIVLELDHRADDPEPAFSISYMQVQVDWDDGNEPVTYNRTSSVQKQTYAGTYPIGRHLVKLKVTNRYNNAGNLHFGNATSSSLNGVAQMPQIIRVKKLDGSGTVANRPKIQSLSLCFNRCLRLESVDCPIIVGNATDLGYFFRFCVNLKGKVEIPYFAATTTFSYAFYNCINLEEVQLGDAPSMTTFNYVFYNCSELKKAKLGAFSNPIPFGYAFWRMQRSY